MIKKMILRIAIGLVSCISIINAMKKGEIFNVTSMHSAKFGNTTTKYVILRGLVKLNGQVAGIREKKVEQACGEDLIESAQKYLENIQQVQNIISEKKKQEVFFDIIDHNGVSTPSVLSVTKAELNFFERTIKRPVQRLRPGQPHYAVPSCRIANISNKSRPSTSQNIDFTSCCINKALLDFAIKGYSKDEIQKIISNLCIAVFYDGLLKELEKKQRDAEIERLDQEFMVDMLNRAFNQQDKKN